MISPITVDPALNVFTIQSEIIADSIPKKWESAGVLYQLIDNPSTVSYPRTVQTVNIPINRAFIIKLKEFTPYYWIQSLPRKRLLWQTVTLKKWIDG